MPYATDRSARLYYDDSCGPCRFFAHAAEATSRHRLVASPLDTPSAGAVLGHLSDERRFGSAHLERDGVLRTGEGITTPLVGLVLGHAWERVVRQVPPIDRSLRRLYGRFWQARRDRGCGAAGRT